MVPACCVLQRQGSDACLRGALSGLASAHFHPGSCCAQHPLLTVFALQAIAAGYVALLAIFILLFRVNVLWIVLYAIVGFPIGLGYSWLLNTARRTRQQTAAQVGHLPASLLWLMSHSLLEVLWSAEASGTAQPCSSGGHPRT